MTKRTPNTTRRDVLAGVGFFAGIAIAAPAVAELVKPPHGADDVAWREFIDWVARWHPNGRAAAERARDAGMDLATFSCLTLRTADCPDPDLLPILWFGDWQTGDHYFTANPKMCGEYRRVHQGDGPDLTEELQKSGVRVGRAVRP